jgi:hypothetical protein
MHIVLNTHVIRTVLIFCLIVWVNCIIFNLRWKKKIRCMSTFGISQVLYASIIRYINQLFRSYHDPIKPSLVTKYLALLCLFGQNFNHLFSKHCVWLHWNNIKASIIKQWVWLSCKIWKEGTYLLQTHIFASRQSVHN